MEVEPQSGACPDAGVQFAEIAARMTTQLRNFLRRFERNPELLDDLVQDVHVEVLKSLRTFSGQSGLETWIYGVALNVGRQHVAKMVTHRQRFVEIDEGFLDESSAPDVVQVVAAQQRLQRVQEKLRDMPHGLALTFAAYVEEGMTYEEAARSLSIPVGTVRSRMYRVRELFLER